MSVLDAYFAGLSALVVAWISVPLICRIAHRMGVLDHPSVRKIHTTPKPRLGGAAIFLGTIFGLGVSLALFKSEVISKDLNWILMLSVGALTSFLIGLWDDFHTISSRQKLLGQVALAALAYGMGFRVSFGAILTASVPLSELINFSVSILWIIAVMNAVNFVDGSDGLAAGVVSVPLLVIGLLMVVNGNVFVGAVILSVAGGSLGFLWHNFFPSKIFMGDSGSLFLGFILAVTSVKFCGSALTVSSAFVPLLFLLFPLSDLFLSVIRRTVIVMDRSSGNSARSLLKSLATPDGNHIHHRLLNMGLSQRQLACLAYAISAFGCLFGVLVFYAPQPLAIFMLLILGLLIWNGIKLLGYEEFEPRAIRMRRREAAYLGDQAKIFRRAMP